MKALTLLLFATLIQGIALAQDADSVYTVVEKSAAPVGGMHEFYKTFSKSVPDTSKKTCILEKVYIEFIVEKDGTLTSFKLLRNDSEGCRQSWIEPFKKLAKTMLWNPGELNGKTVRQRFVLPIGIKLG